MEGTINGRSNIMWYEWINWQMFCCPCFLDEVGVVPYKVWVSIQPDDISKPIVW